MPKADRLLAVLSLLRSRGSLTAAQIADELGVTVRTVYRYIDGLCASGAPIAAEGGPGGGYLLLENFRDTPLFFDAEERTALLHAAMFADGAGYPFSEALHRALAKIRYRMDSGQLSDLARHAVAVDVVAPANENEGRVAGAIAVVESAAAERRRVIIDYSSIGDGTRRKRTIEPYGLVYWSDRWYVVAFCRLRMGMRVFRVDRIRSVEVLEKRFERPEGFSASEWFSRWLMPDLPGSDPPYVVRLAGDGASIDHIARSWFLRRFVTRRADRMIELSLVRRPALEHLPAILLGYGTSVRVVEPEELSQRVAALASEVAQFHSSPRN